MWELIAAVLAGCIVGTLTGLLPGLHTNTIAIIVLSSASLLLQHFEFLVIGVFLISMIVTHSFVDYLPSIFLGAPEASTVLSVLPGHKLLADGQGFDALKHTVVGGISAFTLTLLSLPVLFWGIRLVEPHISFLAAPVLLVLVVYFILLETEYRKIVWALVIYLLAGILGLVTLNGLHIRQALFPMLSGLFGVSILLMSVNSKTAVPKQNISYETKLFTFSNIKSGFKALLAGSFMGLLPTLGPSQAAVLAQGFAGFKKPEKFLVILGGINTVDTLFTLTTLYLIGKARSGVLVVVQQLSEISFHDYLVFVAGAFSALGLAVYITIKLGRGLANTIDRLPYGLLSMNIIILVTAMVLFFSGWVGLIVLAVSTAIGLLSQLSGVRKIHAMGVLSLPVILSYTL